MAKRDYYTILEVERASTAEEIKKAYRKMAVKFHPDKNPGDKSSEERFKEVGEAYEILSDPQKRGAYDQHGHDAFDPRTRSGGGGRGGSQDPFDLFREAFGNSGGNGGSIFGDLFGGGGGGRQDPTGPQRGGDLRYDMEISFEEAVMGCEKEVALTKPDTCDNCQGSGAEKGSSRKSCQTCGGKGQVISSRGIFSVAQTCPRCHGSGQTIEKPCQTCKGAGRRERNTKVKLKIPAGVDTGARLRSTGNGEGGLRGGGNGDLYVVLHVKDHDIFQREGDDLICNVPVQFSDATLGGEIEVPTLTGNATIRIPPGTQNNTMFRLKNRGVRNVQGHGVGDLHVKLQIEVPTRLNAVQKAKLAEFAALCDVHVSPISQGFWAKAKKIFS